jgi:phage terminase small subunit
MAKPPKAPPVQGSQLAFNDAKQTTADCFANMTEKQRLYCEARLTGLVPLRAALRAGLADPEVNAYRMERHPKVQAALAAARRMVVEKFDVSREDVLRGMFDAVQASGNATELVAAWREIGRIVGAYEALKVDVMHRIEDVTLDKLQALSTKELIELSAGKDFIVEAEDDAYGDEYDKIREALGRPAYPRKPRKNDGDDGRDGDDGDDGDADGYDDDDGIDPADYPSEPAERGVEVHGGPCPDPEDVPGVRDDLPAVG